jgi:UDP-N-acetylglucosamine--N-acetylmuramyl-(pentapeptide) pyrophosphoryl-undecaprenol N-acetylglucosamine transferase
VSAGSDEPGRSTQSGVRLSSVLLAGGGSAGHVSPLLALADCLRRRDPDTRVTALGTEKGLEQRLVPARGYDLRTIPKVAFPRKPGGALARLPGALKSAVQAAGRVIDETAPDVVVGFGGYVSTPAYIAARKRGIPIVIHEQNTRPGKANRLGARMTPYVATTFPSTSLPHARVIGMPLRREIAMLDREASRSRVAHWALKG